MAVDTARFAAACLIAWRYQRAAHAGHGGAGFGVPRTARAIRIGLWRIAGHGGRGGVVGGFIYPAIVRRIGAQRSRTLSLALFPAPFLIIGLANNVILVGAMLCFQSLVSVLWNVVTVSYRQRVIPHELLGRVNSIYRFFGWGTISLGAILGGSIVAVAEPALGRDTALALPFIIAQLAPDCCAYGA